MNRSLYFTTIGFAFLIVAILSHFLGEVNLFVVAFFYFIFAILCHFFPKLVGE